MKSLSIAASIVACAVTVTAQGPIQTCPYTVETCLPLVATATVTEFELPGTVTATASLDCHGCDDFVAENHCGLGPVVPVTTVTDYAQSTTTVTVCTA